jgi:hypothetical protein
MLETGKSELQTLLRINLFSLLVARTALIAGIAA